MKRSEASQLEATTFELKVPEPFSLKPEYTVELPSKCQALIFKDKVWAYKGEKGGNQVLVDGWRVITVNSKGRPPRAIDDRYDRGNRGGHTYSSDDPLNIMLHLQQVAWALTKVKKTTTEDIDPED